MVVIIALFNLNVKLAKFKIPKGKLKVNFVSKKCHEDQDELVRVSNKLFSLKYKLIHVVFVDEPPHEPEPSVNVVPEPDEDADLAAILEESKKDYERAEKVRKQEDEELQKAINASLMSAPSTSSSTSQANDESMSKNEAEAINETAEVFYDAVENVDDDSNAMVPESSGLVSSSFVPSSFHSLHPFFILFIVSKLSTHY